MEATMGAERRILSAPYPVHWAGFRSTTTEMQQHGWQIAVEYEPFRRGYRLLFKHEQLRLYALTMEETINECSNSFMHVDALPPFRVCHAAASFEVLRMHDDDLSNFQAVDATPVMVTSEIQRIEDLNVFNVSLRKAEEIVIDQADMSVIEHLEAIKSMQSEEQKEIRKRMLQGPMPGELTDMSPAQAHPVAMLVAVA
jgi:hypothetical protein